MVSTKEASEPSQASTEPKAGPSKQSEDVEDEPIEVVTEVLPPRPKSPKPAAEKSTKPAAEKSPDLIHAKVIKFEYFAIVF